MSTVTAVPGIADARASSAGDSAFERQLLVVPTALALAVWAVLTGTPGIFTKVLALDVSLLAHAHVAGTFCRIWTMDATRRQRRVLSVDALVAAVAIGILAALWSVAIAMTGYLLWQMVHYARQSYGIDRIMRRHEGLAPNMAVSAAIYASSIASLSWILIAAPDTFLGRPLLHIPGWILRLTCASGVVATVASIVAARRELINAGGRRFSAYYWVSHLAIFGLAYWTTRRLEHAWLVSNVWHNTQYLFVVRNAAARASSPGLPFLSRLASVRFGIGVIALCAVVGFAGYAVIGLMSVGVAAQVLVGVYLGINLHHYLADAVVWKRQSSLLARVT